MVGGEVATEVIVPVCVCNQLSNDSWAPVQKLLSPSLRLHMTVLQVLALAMAYQSITSTHLMRPPINEVEPAVLDICLQYSRCGRSEDYNSSEVVNTTYVSESG